MRPRWQRVLWAAAGVLALVTGLVGIFVPLLPTTPFVLLAAFCFSRGSERCERWLLEHPRFGPHRARLARTSARCRCAPSSWPP